MRCTQFCLINYSTCCVTCESLMTSVFTIVATARNDYFERCIFNGFQESLKDFT